VLIYDYFRDPPQDLEGCNRELNSLLYERGSNRLLSGELRRKRTLLVRM
jgi:hypothetical protein